MYYDALVLIIFFIIVSATSATAAEVTGTSHKPFALTKGFTPTIRVNDSVLKGIPDLRRIWEEKLLLDSFGTIDQVGTVLPPNVRCQILGLTTVEYDDGKMIQVATIACGDFYQGPAWVDSRFLDFLDLDPNTMRLLVDEERGVIERIKKFVGKPYIWGGCVPQGIPQLLEFYPTAPKNESKILRQTRTLEGGDCSGALWYATRYNTPRTTRGLISLGKAVNVEGKTAKKITGILRPLDLIVWDGHVLIVMEDGEVFESIHKFFVGGKFGDNGFTGGGRLVPLEPRLHEIMQGFDPFRAGRQEARLPINDPAKLTATSFVVRRWYPGAK